MIYELRTYTPAPGKLARLNQRFREVTLRIFARHGMQLIGFWEAVEHDGDRQDRDLVYLLAFPNQSAYERAWTAFRADEEWIAAKAASESAGALVAAITSRLLQPTDYSPLT